MVTRRGADSLARLLGVGLGAAVLAGSVASIAQNPAPGVGFRTSLPTGTIRIATNSLQDGAVINPPSALFAVADIPTVAATQGNDASAKEDGTQTETSDDHLQKLWQVPAPQIIPMTPAPSTATSAQAPGAATDAQASGATPDGQAATTTTSAQAATGGQPNTRGVAFRTDFTNDPIVRTALSNPRSGSAAWLDGVGGIGSVGNSPFLAGRIFYPGEGFKFGPGMLHGSFGFSAIYQETTGSQGNAQQNGLQPAVSAGFDFSMDQPELKRDLGIAYSAAYSYESHKTAGTNINPFTQSLGMHAGWGLERLTLGLGISYDGLSGVNRDFGGDVNRDLLTLSLTASYVLSPKTSLSWETGIPVQQYSGGINSTEVSNSVFVNYTYSEKTWLGLGVSTGTTEVTGQGSQNDWQLLGRLGLTSSEVLSFFGTFGAEYRLAGDITETNPIFGLGGTWVPRLGTSVTLSANRNVQTSASTAHANYTSTSFSLGVSQRLGRRASLSLSGGYEYSPYTSTESSSPVNRVDTTLYASVGISLALTQYLSGSISYSYSVNYSNVDAFNSSTAQIQLSYGF